MTQCGIYKITNTLDGKLIIGQSNDIKGRWRGYKSELRRNIYHNPYLQSAWNKYGEQNFTFEILLECPKENLNEEEIRLIKEYKSNNRDFGYNLEDGGNNNFHPEETREKLRKAWNYDKHFTEETKAKISKSNTGKAVSKEHRLKISKANTGKHHTEESKRKLREFRNGKKMSEESKQKISKAMSGENNPFFGKHLLGEDNPNFGKHHSEESKQKISQAKTGVPLNLSEEARQKRKERVTGENNPFFGKIHSEETKQKMKEVWQVRRMKIRSKYLVPSA